MIVFLCGPAITRHEYLLSKPSNALAIITLPSTLRYHNLRLCEYRLQILQLPLHDLINYLPHRHAGRVPLPSFVWHCSQHPLLLCSLYSHREPAPVPNTYRSIPPPTIPSFNFTSKPFFPAYCNRSRSQTQPPTTRLPQRCSTPAPPQYRDISSE